MLPDGHVRWVASDILHVGDTVLVHAGEPIPLDGDVIHGAALIDESMMTGESEAVMRETGGDKTSVLGGTRVVQGTIRVRVSAARGESFLDRLIRLVEGLDREPTPNEIALAFFLAAFTIALFTVVRLVRLPRELLRHRHDRPRNDRRVVRLPDADDDRRAASRRSGSRGSTGSPGRT